MRRRRGFTLIEALLALGIASLLLGLSVGWGRRLPRLIETDESEVYVFIQALEQPGRYSLVATTGDEITLADWQGSQKTILLSVNDQHVLKISNQNHRGYVPLLRDVAVINWTPVGHQGLVRLRLLRDRGQRWCDTIVDLRPPVRAS